MGRLSFKRRIETRDRLRLHSLAAERPHAALQRKSEANAEEHSPFPLARSFVILKRSLSETIALESNTARSWIFAF